MVFKWKSLKIEKLKKMKKKKWWMSLWTRSPSYGILIWVEILNFHISIDQALTSREEKCIISAFFSSNKYKPNFLRPRAHKSILTPKTRRGCAIWVLTLIYHNTFQILSWWRNLLVFSEFAEVCPLMHFPNVSQDIVSVRFIPFALKDLVKNMQSLPANSIATWDMFV